MLPSKKYLARSRLYAVYGYEPEADPALEVLKVEAVLKGGADLLQFRCKHNPFKKPALDLCLALKALCRRYQKLFIVNDWIEIALWCDADGLHVGQRDLAARSARERIGEAKILGLSTHSPEQALAAPSAGADYIGFGPIYATPTKADYVATGIEPLKTVVQAVKIPVFAIGGINERNCAAVVEGGGNRRIAAVRSLFDAADPESACRRLLQILDEPVISQRKD